MTNETMPWHLWLDAVLGEAGTSVEDAAPHRVRLRRSFQAGEPVWMAAEGLRFCVDRMRREAKGHDDGRAAIRAAYRARTVLKP